MIMSDFERIRLVLLGGPFVGKSCIVRRFLTKSYNDKYRPTVEDLHNREYDLGSVTLKVSIIHFFNVILFLLKHDIEVTQHDFYDY